MKISKNRLIQHFFHSLILPFILVLLPLGQTANATTDAYPLKPLDTSSPRATMDAFMEVMDRAYQTGLDAGFQDEAVLALLNRAAECFDLSEVAPNLVKDVGVETALLLKEIFDRIELPPAKRIPDQTTIGFDGLTRWRVPNTAIQIILVEKGPRQGEFLFSNATVDRMKAFYDRVVHLPYKPGSSVGAYEDYIFGPGRMIPQGLSNVLTKGCNSYLNI